MLIPFCKRIDSFVLVCVYQKLNPKLVGSMRFVAHVGMFAFVSPIRETVWEREREGGASVSPHGAHRPTGSDVCICSRTRIAMNFRCMHEQNLKRASKQVLSLSSALLGLLRHDAPT